MAWPIGSASGGRRGGRACAHLGVVREKVNERADGKRNTHANETREDEQNDSVGDRLAFRLCELEERPDRGRRFGRRERRGGQQPLEERLAPW